MEIEVPQYDNTDPITMLKSMNDFDTKFKRECEAFDLVSAMAVDCIKQFKGRHNIEITPHRMTVFAEFKEDLMMLKLAISG